MHVRVESLSHTYFQQLGRPLSALQEIDLEIQSGEFIAVLGPSGCGKSTFLRALSGLLKPSAGQVLLDGEPPHLALHAKRIGWLAQNPALLPWHTARENIALAQRINPQNGRTLLSPDDLLGRMGLSDYAGNYPFSLSGGMKHRVALARTLALNASLWLMDEPFAALDELTREALTEELLSLWTQFRPTAVWVTHHIYEAARLANRVFILTPRPGRIATCITIPLSYPRDETQPEFGYAVHAIRAALRSSQERV
ncbi:MAG: ABC transporter ATP-binding protein [Chloroflexota bacterium]